MSNEYRQSDDFKDTNAKPVVVVGILVHNSEGKVLLATGEKFKGKWVLIGGHVDFGETIEQAVIRETKEETNLDVEDVKYITLIELIGSKDFTMKKHFVCVNYSALAKNITKLKLNDELTDYKWIDPKEALETSDLNDSTRETIEKFLDQ